MQLAFILVEPKRAANVGAAARALYTMGFDDLRIVGDPLQTTGEARALAHGSHQVLQAARHFTDLETALTDLDLVIGTSAKTRHQRRYHHSPTELARLLQDKGASVGRAGLLFGREECGLDNATIRRCDLLTQVPQAVAQPSLNLAQSVMVYSYSLSGLQLEASQRPAQPEQFAALKPKLARLLSQAGIEAGEKTERWAMERLAAAADEDVKFLHFICDKLQQALDE